jgi:hypothetical protein
MVCDAEAGTDGPGCHLTRDQRSWLRGEVGDRINAALVSFLAACHDKRDELRAALKAQRDMLGLVLNLAMGFGVGKLGALAVSGINKIPNSAPDWVTSAAVGVLNKAGLVKSVMDKATKKATNAITSQVGGDAVAFVEKLRESSSAWAQSARGEVPGMLDDELLVAYITWDANNTSIADYKAALDQLVSRFKSQVMRMTEMAPAGGSKSTYYSPLSGLHSNYKAVWVAVYGGQKSLASVRFNRESDPDGGIRKGSREYYFEQWIDTDMQQMAIERSRSRFGEIETISMSELRGL